ncbi:hypothetical protein [Prosthecobacter sp.]|uniref:hypothetical protein n=1 Tax=Prosthecobacter sp. TaxID=1965333 RepID=UPI0037834A6C
MKRPYPLHVLLVVALLGLASFSQAAEDRDDVAEAYFQAFVVCNAGMKAALAGQREAAIANLKSAQSAILEIQKSHPTWQSEIVAFRLKKIATALKSLGEE